MPISASDLYRHFHECTTPNLGIVELEGVARGFVVKALEDADAVAEAEQGSAFSNQILSEIMVDPNYDVSAVAELPEEDIAPLVECASVLLGIRDELQQLDSAIPGRDRLLIAYTNHYRQLYKGIVNSLAPKVRPELWMPNPSISILTAFGMDTFSGNIAKSLGVMATVNLKTMIPSFSIDASSLLGRIDAFKGISEALTLASSSSYRTLLDSLSAISLPEPYLSRTMLESGLISSETQTPTYVLPVFEPIETEEDLGIEEEKAHQLRATGTYDTLYLLETELRRLVRERLQNIYGHSWWKQGFHKDVRANCQDRKVERETPDSLSHHPIEYTYLGQLKDAIVKSNHWNAEFSELFEGDKQTLEVMFTFVMPARNDTAHMRQLSDDEYQEFQVGAKWIMRRIARHTRLRSAQQRPAA